MLKLAVTHFKPTGQRRYASVLSSSTFTSTSIRHNSATEQHDLPYIVTPAHSSFTTPSNNAFHPAHIPKNTQVRLTLEELKQVLDSSKQLFHHLQQEYVDKSLVQTPLHLQQYIEQLTNEQLKLIESLTSRRRGKKSTRNDNE